MIRVKTKYFFNSPKVRRKVDKGTRYVLSGFGYNVRRFARNSIKSVNKKNKKRVSSPGQPPFSRTGLLRNFIFYGYDYIRRSVIIGPQRLYGIGKGKAPNTLEYGGKAKTPDGNKIRIQARPFMRPAFEKGKKQLPPMWKDSIKR